LYQIQNGVNKDQNPTDLPTEFSLDAVYPNPFNPTASIKFSLRDKVHVTAMVFNLLGREVAVLSDRPMTAGSHQLTFDGSNLTSGIYFLRFEAGPMSEMRKLILIK